MKFAHMGDCHLGGWRQPELSDLNFKSFQIAIDRCIKEKVDFILITGDLFDSAYPPIDTLKDAFSEFRRLKEHNIPVFLIAGSHDYSVSGKSFLDVLDRAGFCTNTSKYEERNGQIILEPTIFKNAAIYGFPGRKSSLEVEEISRMKLQDSPGLFKILMLHTAIKDAVGTAPIEAVDEKTLPKVNYLALSHLHIIYSKDERVYSGPIFPNNLLELEELRGGSFYIFDNGKIRREEIKLKQIFVMHKEIKDAYSATDQIIKEIEKEELKDKIVILKLYGILEKGKVSDIDFKRIEDSIKQKKPYVILKSTTKLHVVETEAYTEIADSSNLEEQIIKKFIETNPSKYNESIPNIIRALQSEKNEDEKSSIFEERLLAETRKIIKL